MTPQVTVIMPCFNHGRFIEESVLSILSQSYRDLELLVINDNSNDNSLEVLNQSHLRDPRLIVFSNPLNRGASYSRNVGLRRARGQFITFCDADDLWKSNKVEQQLSILASNPDCDVAYADSEIIDAAGQLRGNRFSHLFPTPPQPSGDIFPFLAERNFINMQSAMIRLTGFQTLPLFDETIKWVEDWWFWIQLSQSHRFIYDAESCGYYRVHPQSSNRSQRKSVRRHSFRVLSKVLLLPRTRNAPVIPRLFYRQGLELRDLQKFRSAERCFRRALWRSVFVNPSPRTAALSALRLMSTLFTLAGRGIGAYRNG